MKPTEKIPTQAEQIKFLKDQMPLKRLQVELQKLNTDFVELKVREFEAITKLQQIEEVQAKSKAEHDAFLKENMTEHTITQEDLDNNPEMVESKLEVGQKIGIPKDIYGKLNLSKPVEDQLAEVEQEVKADLKVVKD